MQDEKTGPHLHRNLCVHIITSQYKTKDYLKFRSFSPPHLVLSNSTTIKGKRQCSPCVYINCSWIQFRCQAVPKLARQEHSDSLWLCTSHRFSQTWEWYCRAVNAHGCICCWFIYVTFISCLPIWKEDLEGGQNNFNYKRNTGLNNTTPPVKQTSK